MSHYSTAATATKLWTRDAFPSMDNDEMHDGNEAALTSQSHPGAKTVFILLREEKKKKKKFFYSPVQMEHDVCDVTPDFLTIVCLLTRLLFILYTFLLVCRFL